MALLKDILEIETTHKENGPYSTIYLFPEGTFYRAYEWSAWICCRFINEFKTTRRELKGKQGESAVFIGFPITSLSKFLPEDAQVKNNEDKSVAVTLPLSVFQDESDAEALRSAFDGWKESVPLAAPRRSSLREDLRNTPETPPRRMSDIMQRILLFPVEQKTPMECMNFITDIKQDIAKLL